MGISVSKSTTATVTFSTPQEIIISHTDDSIRIGDGTDLAGVTAAGALQVDGSGVTQPISAASLPLPSGAATAANQSTANTSLSSIDGKMNSLGQKTGANSMPVVIASDNTPTVIEQAAATSSVTSVSASASSVQLLAALSSRKAALFYNDSNKDLYLKLGTTASTASFSVKIPAGGYYELPLPVYSGRIDGIWTGTGGSVLITELN